MFRVESPHRKMTSLLGFSFVVDNEPQGTVFEPFLSFFSLMNLKGRIPLCMVMRRIIHLSSMWKIPKSHCMWKVHIGSTFFSESAGKMAQVQMGEGVQLF